MFDAPSAPELSRNEILLRFAEVGAAGRGAREIDRLFRSRAVTAPWLDLLEEGIMDLTLKINEEDLTPKKVTQGDGK